MKRIALIVALFIWLGASVWPAFSDPWRLPTPMDPCGMPAAAPGAMPVAVSVYHGASLSTTWLGSPGKSTSSAEVVIENGREPLYLVLTSGPVLWRFSGAVERIDRVVLGGNDSVFDEQVRVFHPLVGVSGVPREKVSFLMAGADRCIRVFSSVPSVDASIVMGSVRRATGVAPALFASEFRMASISLPSGGMEVPEASAGIRLTIINKGKKTVIRNDGTMVELPSDGPFRWDRAFPAGTVEIDTATVVADVPVGRYAVLPGMVGLESLIASGDIVRSASDQREFVVRRATALPAQTSETYGIRFLLADGVPPPTVIPPGVCVLERKSGNLVGGDARVCTR